MFRIKQCPESSLKVVSCADDFSDSSPYCIVPAQASDPRETNRPLLIIDRKDSQQPPPPPFPLSSTTLLTSHLGNHQVDDIIQKSTHRYLGSFLRKQRGSHLILRVIIRRRSKHAMHPMTNIVLRNTPVISAIECR